MEAVLTDIGDDKWDRLHAELTRVSNEMQYSASLVDFFAYLSGCLRMAMDRQKPAAAIEILRWLSESCNHAAFRSFASHLDVSVYFNAVATLASLPLGPDVSSSVALFREIVTYFMPRLTEQERAQIYHRLAAMSYDRIDDDDAHSLFQRCKLDTEQKLIWFFRDFLSNDVYLQCIDANGSIEHSWCQPIVFMRSIADICIDRVWIQRPLDAPLLQLSSMVEAFPISFTIHHVDTLKYIFCNIQCDQATRITITEWALTWFHDRFFDCEIILSYELAARVRYMFRCVFNVVCEPMVLLNRFNQARDATLLVEGSAFGIFRTEWRSVAYGIRALITQTLPAEWIYPILLLRRIRACNNNILAHIMTFVNQTEILSTFTDGTQARRTMHALFEQYAQRFNRQATEPMARRTRGQKRARGDETRIVPWRWGVGGYAP
jgi:hypothetical protein